MEVTAILILPSLLLTRALFSCLSYVVMRVYSSSKVVMSMTRFFRALNSPVLILKVVETRYCTAPKLAAPDRSQVPSSSHSARLVRGGGGWGVDTGRMAKSGDPFQDSGLVPTGCAGNAMVKEAPSRERLCLSNGVPPLDWGKQSTVEGCVFVECHVCWLARRFETF